MLSPSAQSTARLSPEEETENFVSSQIPSIVSALENFIRIPNLSPEFDKKNENFNVENTNKVVELFTDWAEQQKLKNFGLKVLQENKKTPLILIEIGPTGSPPPKDDGVVLMYGHLDKQPPFHGWDEGLGPYQPVLKDGRLYGRGGADDGYAFFAALTSVKAAQATNRPHPRILILIEAAEESGSVDLLFYLEKILSPPFDYKDKISLVICLDSGAGDFQHPWLTTSLRGILSFDLTVKTLTQGVHSGDGSGICSDSFRTLRQLLDSVEDSRTGEVAKDLAVEIPKNVLDEAKAVAALLGDKLWERFPLVNKTPNGGSADLVELILKRSWKPTLTLIGQDGLPKCAEGGNVIRPETKVKLSFRLPPTFEDHRAFEIVKNLMEKAKPADCQLKFENVSHAAGWAAPQLEPWLRKALEDSAEKFYGKSLMFNGEGGSIPFMGILRSFFPKAQFVVTGVLGPNSNAHGPNEFLDIFYMKKLINFVSHILTSAAKFEQEI